MEVAMRGLGKEVFHWQRIIPNLGIHSNGIEAELNNRLLARSIPDLRLAEISLGRGRSAGKYLLVQRGVGGTATVSAAVRIEAYGTDLALECRYFESSPARLAVSLAAKGAKGYLAIGFIGAGILTIWIGGAGVILILIGLWIWSRGGPSSAFSESQRRESALFREAVELSLTEAINQIAPSNRP
jgi:hypothetical protein